MLYNEHLIRDAPFGRGAPLTILGYAGRYKVHNVSTKFVRQSSVPPAILPLERRPYPPYKLTRFLWWTCAYTSDLSMDSALLFVPNAQELQFF